MSDFYIGQKVICVNPDGPDTRGIATPFKPDEMLHKGRIYTITAILFTVTEVFHLAEVRRTKAACDHYNEPQLGYGSYRFRPLESQAIQLFRDIAAGITPLIPDDKLDEVEQREIAAMWDAGGRPIW